MNNVDLGKALASMSATLAKAELRFYMKEPKQNDKGKDYRSISCQAWGAGLVYQCVPVKGGRMIHIPREEFYWVDIIPFDSTAIEPIEIREDLD